MPSPSLTFTSDLDMRAVRGHVRRFLLVDDFTGTANGRDWLIPKGFETDLVSTEKALENIISNDDFDVLWAAVWHDYAYQVNGALWPEAPPFTRAECDGLLIAGMITLGAPWWKRPLVWLAVRLGGGFHWHDNTPTSPSL
ncbi:MAG: hypothetical protein JWO94_1273 [Verrucomicrobiaceae bacterium]|nr:hypothetical protein [Verrucomicrobiaceae bacterium]